MRTSDCEPIPHSKPWITEADKQAVMNALNSGLIARGGLAADFEHAFAEYLNASYAIATSSGTSAMLLALHSLGIGHGQEVILPTYVCDSVLSAVQETGATPVLCDVGDGWIMTPDSIAPHVCGKTGAIIAVHMFGHPVEVLSIMAYGVPVIEDVCQAFGAKKDGKLLGTTADIGVYSFHATKCMTTGEGGMMTTNKPDIMERARMMQHMYPMADVNAALGLSQLGRYEAFIERRRIIAARYTQRLSVLGNMAIRLPPPTDYYFRYTLETPMNPICVMDQFMKCGITVRRGVDALLHRRLGLSDHEFTNAVKRFAATISIPLYPALEQDSVDRILKCCLTILGGKDDEN